MHAFMKQWMHVVFIISALRLGKRVEGWGFSDANIPKAGTQNIFFNLYLKET